MTTTLSAALRMPLTASVAAPAPLALGVSAEPCALKAALLPSHRAYGPGLGGITAPAFAGRRDGTDGSDRFGGITRSSIGGGWHRQDQAQNAGGGPLRG
jgi:hypothetical protein